MSRISLGVLVAAVLVAASLLGAPVLHAQECGDGAFHEGFGRLVLPCRRNPGDRSLPVWFYQPTRYDSASPVVFVLHGIRREAYTYRDEWVKFAESRNFLLLVPEFSEKAFPGSTYPQGHMFDGSGRPVEKSGWGFSVVEELFDRVREMTGNRSEGYYLFGHSAGGQFVHRMILFRPDARVLRAVAANPGFYTLPVDSEPFPYGLKGAPSTPGQLKAAFRRDLVVLLGEVDTSDRGAAFPRTPGAMKQGGSRLARGRNFLAVARGVAEKRHLAFAWTLQTVPGAGHSDAQMAEAAVRVLFGPPEIQPAASPGR